MTPIDVIIDGGCKDESVAKQGAFLYKLKEDELSCRFDNHSGGYMKTYLKVAYVSGAIALLAFIWNGIPAIDAQDDLFSRLMSLRLIGFVALMLVLYYIFFNFLGKNKKND